MSEDMKFNASVRDAMEDGIEIDAAAVIASLSTRSTAGCRWLIAASFVMTLMMTGFITSVKNAKNDDIAEALAFMIAADGDIYDLEVDSADELLMLWQDMPISGL